MRRGKGFKADSLESKKNDNSYLNTELVIEEEQERIPIGAGLSFGREEGSEIPN